MSVKRAEKSKTRRDRTFLMPLILISTIVTLVVFILVGVLTGSFLIGAGSAAAALTVTVVTMHFILKKRVPDKSSKVPDSEAAIVMHMNELRTKTGL